MSRRPYEHLTDAELSAEIAKLAPCRGEAIRRLDAAEQDARLRRLEAAVTDLQQALPSSILDTGRRIDAVARAAAEAVRKADQAWSDRDATGILSETHQALNRLPELYRGKTFTQRLVRGARRQYVEDLQRVDVPAPRTLPLFLRNVVIAIGLLSDSRDGLIDRIQRIIRRSNYKFHRLNKRVTQIEAHLGCPEWSEPDGPGVGEDD